MPGAVATQFNAQGMGCQGDGVTDDTYSLNNALQILPAGETLHVPKGTYKTTTGLQLLDGKNISFDIGAVVTASTAGRGALEMRAPGNIQILGRGVFVGAAGQPAVKIYSGATSGLLYLEAVTTGSVSNVGGVTISGPNSSSLNVITAFGLVPNGRMVADAAITSGQNILTSATAAFTAADVGKAVSVYFANSIAGGSPLSTTIASYTNATTVVLAMNASETVSTQTCYIGTDNTSAMTAALAACPKGGTLHFPGGMYLVGLVTLVDGITLDFASQAILANPFSSNGYLAMSTGGMVVRITGKGQFPGGQYQAFGVSCGSKGTFYLDCESMNNVYADSNGGMDTFITANIFGEMRLATATTHYITAKNFSALEILSASTIVYSVGTIGYPIVTNSLAVNLFAAGYWEHWGDVYAGSGAVQLWVGGTATVHGNLITNNDCPAYVDMSGVLTVFGNVTNLSTGAYNLLGNGSGCCVGNNGTQATSKIEVFGNVTAPLPITCGDGSVIVHGNVIQNGSTGSLHLQPGPYSPGFSVGGLGVTLIAAAQPTDLANYAGHAIVEYNTGKVKVYGNVLSPISQPLRLEGGTIEVLGEVTCTSSSASLGHAVLAGAGTLVLRGGTTLTAGSGVSDVINCVASVTNVSPTLVMNVLGECKANKGSATPSNVTFGTSGLYNIAGVENSNATSLAVGGVAVQLSGSPITGTTTNDNAAAGKVGEFITASIATGSSVSLTSGTTANVTSISLTSGDWNVFGVVDFNPGATTVTTYFQGGISQTTATLGAQDTFFSNTFAIATTSTDASEVCPVLRVSLATTTTIYLVAKAGFTISTLKAYGTVSARRVR